MSKRPKELDLAKLLPELNENQLKMLSRYMLFDRIQARLEELNSIAQSFCEYDEDTWYADYVTKRMTELVKEFPVDSQS